MKDLKDFLTKIHNFWLKKCMIFEQKHKFLIKMHHLEQVDEF